MFVPDATKMVPSPSRRREKRDIILVVSTESNAGGEKENDIGGHERRSFYSYVPAP
jgi:hypothetical protein